MAMKKQASQSSIPWLAIISFSFFVVRLIHAQLLLNHAYLGADGPNYISGFLSIDLGCRWLAS